MEIDIYSRHGRSGISMSQFVIITLFIFLAQFLVTTKIKAKKLVTTKIFGRDQFFCLNFGRDQKLGEENEKGLFQKTRSLVLLENRATPLLPLANQYHPNQSFRCYKRKEK